MAEFWEIVWQYARVFAVGGLICVLAQILIDKTKITPARILVGYVGIGVLLVASGLSEPVLDWAGCGVTTPIIGFGISLAKGVREAVGTYGALGILSGGLSATSVGVSAVIVFAFLAAVLSKPRDKG